MKMLKVKALDGTDYNVPLENIGYFFDKSDYSEYILMVCTKGHNLAVELSHAGYINALKDIENMESN